MAQIARQHADTIQTGLLVRASDVNDELNSLVNESNSQDTRVAVFESGDPNPTGDWTFAEPVSGVDGSDAANFVTYGRLTASFNNSNTPHRPRYIPGRYYSAEDTNSTTAAAAGEGIGTGTATVTVPFFVSNTNTFDRIGVYCGAADAGSTVRLGIYSSLSNSKPGVLLLNAGTVSTATTGAKEATISQSLDPGWYWLAVRVSSALVGLQYRNVRDWDFVKVFGLPSIPTTTQAALVLGGAYEDAANFPATYTTSPTLITASPVTQVPAVFMRSA